MSLNDGCPDHPGAPTRPIDGGSAVRCQPVGGAKCKWTREKGGVRS